MCDGIDKNQQLLEKLSRQLSELTSSGSAHINEIPPPGIGSQWAQSGGLPSENHPHQHHHSPFSPLYTWDPSFLQAPSSSPSCTSPHLSNPGFNLHEPPTSSSFPFPPPTNYGQVGGHIGNLSPDPGFPAREFQVSGDLSGRFSNIPRSPPPSQDYNPIRSPHHSYHHSQTPIVGRSFGPPASPKEDLFPDLSSVLGGDSSPLSTHRNFDILHSPTVNNQHLHSNSLENVHNSNNSSCDIASSNPFFKPPPTFDPRTPPPSFPLPRQISDSTGQISSASLSSNSTEFLDFLRLQSDPGIGLNLDLGATNLGDTTPWQTFPVENETISSSEEGKQLYSDALNNWNSFDFSDIDNSKTTEDTYNPVQIDEEVSFTEPTVQSQDPSKPSYSDIAKTPKVATSSPRVEQTNSDSTAKSRFVTKDGKPYRPLIQRTISASKFWPKGSSDRVIEQPKVSPTSRYGLDSFEDSPSGLAKTSDSLGCTTRTKRSSSSAAVLDDLSLNMMEKNVNSYKDDSLSTKDLKPRADQKTKSNMVDTQEKVNTSPPSVKMPTVPSSSPEPEEKLFFDPKRIFQPKNTNKSRAQSPAQKVTGKSNVYDKKPSELEDTVLNNGKPTSSSFKLPTAARQHDYINNDLRDTNKVTNKTAAEGVHTTTTVQDINEEVHTKPKESSRSTSGKRSGTGRVNGSFNKDKRKMTDDDTNYKYADAQNGHKFLAANFDREKFDKWLSLAWEKLITWGFFLFTHAKAFFVSALGIFYIVTCSTLQLTWFTASKCWVVIKTKIYAKLGKTTNDSPGWRSKESVRRRVGLEEKIALPSTGEEAMKRLLACKGKDPYSILGVRQDSSDEDIKKYYRKQAVLVHPDKNQEPGAEESFKILGHAFEKIGEPSKRKEYDTQAVVESESELRKEFADLITKLQTKIQEAANLMPCDNCGNKHRRVPVDRPFYSARYCQRCNIRHPAKEGDVWAESSMLGFYWNYYALMEGHVYDITEWMKCHQEFYKRMRANEHTVLTRIATDGNKKAKHHHNREANLEDFINRFFPKMPGQAGGASSQSNGGQAAHGADSAWGQASGSATNAKKAGGGKRKKKRH